MSGDVQPKKRRDKKKKKDDGEETTTTHQQFASVRAPTPPNNNDDVNIHVYKETSTGGGICAKFVFFILLAALAVLIGLIITEHRGLSDLDKIETETRYSQIFEGWVDKSPNDHDDHEKHIDSHEHADSHEEVDHEHEDEDHDKKSEEEEEEADVSEEDEEKNNSRDEDEDEEDEGAQDESAEDVSAQDESAQDESAQDVSAQDESAQDESVQDVSAQDESEQDVSAQDESEQAESAEDVSAQDESAQDESAQDVSTQDESEQDVSAQDVSAENSKEDDHSAQADNDEDDSAHNTEASDEEQELSSKQNENEEVDRSKENDDNPDEKERSNEEVDENETTNDGEAGDGISVKDENEDAPEAEEATSEDGEQTNAGVAVKFGVGVAIVVVAYVVLVRKWKSDKTNETIKREEASIDLSRRNTIIVPPKIEEFENSLNDDEELLDYSDEEIEEEIKLHPTVKENYQKLRSTYERSLTPESEPEPQEVEYEDEDEDEDENEYEDDEDHEGHDEHEEREEVEEEEEEVEEEEEPLSEIDDEDLLKKLEAKYGKIDNEEEVEPEEEEYEDEYDEDEYDEDEDEEEDEDENYQWKRTKPSSAQQYENTGAQSVYNFANITNDFDDEIRDQLDEAQDNIHHNAALALTKFNKLLVRYPKSPRALYGKAQSLDSLADQKRSNELLKEAVTYYLEVLKAEIVPSILFITTAERCINRMRFIGQYGKAISVHKLLIDRFPDNIKYRNQLAVTYLTTNRIPEARQLLQETLRQWPKDGFALVHYGFILKVNDKNLEKSIEYLERGLATNEEGVIDGRFYFHLGDAFTRLGRINEANQVYLNGVKNNVFLSKYQRSLYNVNRLTGRAWWKKSQASQYKQFYKLLEQNYKEIRDEGLAVLNQKGYFQDEAENLRDVGDWKQFELYARGFKNKKNCKKCPFTCKIIETLPDATGCRRGQIKFSVMHPGTHVWPHCGPTNCRLRVHLGLKVPPKTYIRVADETRSWADGKVIIFDDSFEHEVWHNGTEFRLVLIVDVWHPELTVTEKQSLSAI